MPSLEAFTGRAVRDVDSAAARGRNATKSLAALLPQDAVAIADSTAYWSGDYLYVDGVVQNDYAYALDQVQVKVTLKDVGGSVVDSQTTYVDAYRIGDGKYASFFAEFYLPPDGGNYSIEAWGYQESLSLPVQLTPGGSSGVIEDGVRVYSQVFRNDSPYPVVQPLVGGWELDADGNLVDTLYAYDDTVEIPSGGSWISEFVGLNSVTPQYAYAYAQALPVSYDPVPGRVTRIAGTDRYGTAAALARKGWDPTGTKAWTGVRDIIIANGEPGKEPDPLTAAGLAGVYSAPVLTVQVGKVPTATKTVITEIARKNPGVRIHIVGGTSVVPDARWTDIRRIAGVGQVKDRISGSDRYGTSAAMATRMVSLVGPDAINGFILIAGDNPAGFYDALAASPIAYGNTMPMLSVKKGSIPSAVNNVLTTAGLTGKPRYSASSSAYIGAPARGAIRLTSSSNRYTAATQIGNYAIDQGWADAWNTAIASSLPDALTGGAFLGSRYGVLLFTDSSKSIQTGTKSFIGNADWIMDGWVIGGTAVVPTNQESSFRNLIQ